MQNLLLTVILILSSWTWPQVAKTAADAIEVNGPSTIRMQAYQVLVNKCNVCHATKNRNKIFSLDNMDQLSAQINKQVFEKRRMPKGKEFPLLQEEYDQLEKWIKSLPSK